MNPLDSAFDIGLDIIEIDRISSLAERNPRFLERIFSKDEISYCKGKKKQWQHFAVRFAAKEAVWKAMGPGLPLRDITISRGPGGRPSVLIAGREQPGIRISLSHGDRYAMAVAFCVGDPA